MSSDTLKLRTAVLYNRARLALMPYGESAQEVKLPPKVPESARPNSLNYVSSLFKAPAVFRAVLANYAPNLIPQQLLNDIIELEALPNNVTPFYSAAKRILLRSENLAYAAQFVETSHEASLARAAVKAATPKLTYDVDGLLLSGLGAPSERIVTELSNHLSLLRELQLPTSGSSGYLRFVEGFEDEELKLEVALLTVML